MLDLLAEVVEQVKSGKAVGLLVAVKYEERHHGIGLVGEYLDDPAPVLAVVSRIDYRINQLVDERLRRPRPGKVSDFDSRK